MALSDDAKRQLAIALTKSSLANEVADAIDAGSAVSSQMGMMVAAVIVATDTSQTTDFGSLAVGDKVIMIPATAGNADFISIATAGDLGQAAVVGNIYIAFRAFVAPAASSFKF